MNSYKVTTYETSKVTRRVAANSMLEAAELAENGNNWVIDSEQIGEPDKSKTEVILEDADA
jgi:hypothetical protein